jgi:hypothetical protein
MAGSVNIVARRPQSANITVTIITARNIRKDQRWRSGLMRNTGGGSFAPAAVYQKDLLSRRFTQMNADQRLYA